MQIPSQQAHVLIIDTNEFCVSYIKNCLSKQGLRSIHTATNGLAAYSKFMQCHQNGNPINLILIDPELEFFKGRTIVEKIREYEKKKNLAPARVLGLVEDKLSQSFVRSLEGEEDEDSGGSSPLEERYSINLNSSVTEIH